MPKKKGRSKKATPVLTEGIFLEHIQMLKEDVSQMNNRLDLLLSGFRQTESGLKSVVESLRWDIKLEILERVGKWGAVLDRRIDGIRATLKDHHEFWGEYDRKV